MTFLNAAIIGSAVVGAVGSRSAAKTQAGAAKEAGQYQLTAARETIAEQRRQFDLAQKNAQPWMAAGRRSLSRMEELLYGPPRPQAQNPWQNRPAYGQQNLTNNPYVTNQQYVDGLQALRRRGGIQRRDFGGGAMNYRERF